MALDILPIDEGPISILGLDFAVGGHLHGLSQPFLEVRFGFISPPAVGWAPIDAALAGAIPSASPSVAAAEPLRGALQRVLHWTGELQRDAGDGAFEPGRLLWQAGDGAELTVAALPALDPNTAALALSVVVSIVNRGLGGAQTAADLLTSARRAVDALREERSYHALTPVTALLLASARALGVPWTRVGMTNIIQLGHGARARWIEDAFSDATPVMGVMTARNKAAAGSLLRHHGLPIPPQKTVLDADQAAAAAEEMGYPVVVKPLDTDMGVGVSVNLRTAESVRTAFAEACRHSPKVLVEGFIEGRDFRLTVVQGRLIWAVERVAGGVTGDGHSTVQALLERLNADPERSGRRMARLKPLALNEEAAAFLADQGLTPVSVPEAGRRVRLRGAANLALGGTRIDVFDQVHPDNRRLAERAAQALRLDIAGIDLIIPDIGRSWMEVGAGICEVNARPDLLTTIPEPAYRRMVAGLIDGDGRIPIAVIVGAPAGSHAAELAARIVSAAGICVGRAERQGAWVGGDLVARTDVFEGARLLLGDTTVEAAIVSIDNAAIATTGLPFDRCRVIALAGSTLSGAVDSFDRLALSLLPMKTAALVINADDAACVALAAHAGGGAVILHGSEDGAAIQAHRASGGPAAWIAEAGGELRLVIASGPGASMTIALPEGVPDLRYSADDIVLAASVAGALGCGEAHLRQGLAGVGVA